jgi:nucleotide-binding universal stress UspA family protein
MYKHILIPLENSPTDNTILTYIRPLARLTKAKLTLIHVADGFQARHQKQLGESEEMRRDRDYLEKCEQELRADGLEANAILAWGDPATRILETAETGQCDLIAMATHGHRALADLLYGSVASEIHHRAKIPVLMLKG